MQSLRARRPLRSRPSLDPHTSDRPTPIEILARMAGRTTFRTPRDPGASTAFVTPLDIAHALATSTDKLGAAMAMAMACQRPRDWPRVEELAHGVFTALVRKQPSHAALVEPPYTYRVRVALFDAFGDLIAPARHRNLGAAARDAKMRRNVYLWLLRQAMSMLEDAANSAAADAVRYLFSLESLRGGSHEELRALLADVGVTTASAVDAAPDDLDVLIGQLCADVLNQRPRRAGVLRLRENA